MVTYHCWSLSQLLAKSVHLCFFVQYWLTSDVSLQKLGFLEVLLPNPAKEHDSYTSHFIDSFYASVVRILDIWNQQKKISIYVWKITLSCIYSYSEQDNFSINDFISLLSHWTICHFKAFQKIYLRYRQRHLWLFLGPSSCCLYLCHDFLARVSISLASDLCNYSKKISF